jgi:hypothetical protein
MCGSFENVRGMVCLFNFVIFSSFFPCRFSFLIMNPWPSHWIVCMLGWNKTSSMSAYWSNFKIFDRFIVHHYPIRFQTGMVASLQSHVGRSRARGHMSLLQPALPASGSIRLMQRVIRRLWIHSHPRPYRQDRPCFEWLLIILILDSTLSVNSQC